MSAKHVRLVQLQLGTPFFIMINLNEFDPTDANAGMKAAEEANAWERRCRMLMVGLTTISLAENITGEQAKLLASSTLESVNVPKIKIHVNV
jgi:hypothetical protein